MHSNKSDKIKTVVWGASGHALVVANALRMQRNFEILGFIDDINPIEHVVNNFGYNILGGKEQIPYLKQQNIKHIALGFGHCSSRIELGDYLLKEDFVLVTVIHPNTIIGSNVEIGCGTVLLAGVVVDPQCQIGNYCIINNNSTISHNSILDKGVHICPGVHIGGRVNIGTGSWIGIGSCIIEDVNIGYRSFIGAGSVVVEDIPDRVLAYGNPARVIKSIEGPF